ncbi:hypothetical protein BSL82_10380 [Tardibacter chloracetimidivorans]|uniref:Uncharacterized protein n=2 Tax=Tardibacter chloracetimidivorans TaxID=1921510 RepID=A0A1L3ZVJ3_9SPHN|nr:hypothetical protein BSL82_10380 [Tardibacter chloracetimidivorans]
MFPVGVAASVYTGAFRFLREALESNPLNPARTVTVKLLSYDVICPVRLVGTKLSQTDRAGHQVSKLQSARVGLLIGKHDFHGGKLNTTIIATVLDASKFQF